ncbi:uncharacterized protein LOC117181974 isoform X2 [Belonocnema kinseyi]|uniref:uncharacterized protein LOC117181974 isoform X2 n=1 Tax=Belonocnema kinseyi TaxID=2817044 RepID=UPI00143D67EA|nr:uncharacterized protein LOC117181974 isoform X2 [Belonocnema kinseyi]
MAVTSAGIRMADMLTTPVTSILMPNISYTPSAEVLETELCIANGFEAFNFLKIDSSTEIESQKNKPGLTDQEKEEIIRALWKIESSFTGSSSNEDRIIFMAAIKSAVEITKYYLNKMSDLDKEEINYKILGMKHICLHRLKLRIAQTEAQIISIRNEIQSQSARFSNSCSRSLKICQMDTTFCGLWTFLMCTATSYLMWNMEGKRNGPSIAVVFGFIAMGCYAGNALVLIRACCKR